MTTAPTRPRTTRHGTARHGTAPQARPAPPAGIPTPTTTPLSSPLQIAWVGFEEWGGGRGLMGTSRGRTRRINSDITSPSLPSLPPPWRASTTSRRLRKCCSSAIYTCKSARGAARNVAPFPSVFLSFPPPSSTPFSFLLSSPLSPHPDHQDRATEKQ